ncbi:MAG: DnaD domain protein [Lachnospiraceae bacterium]|nr:DnaD domain protein [Lachnospiraceae bacterium]
MDSIILRGSRYSGNTIVSNCFIDEYMADANGAQLKIYLYLMRCIEADEPVTVPRLADRFNYTETDIIRSLLYWARKGIISIEFDEDRNVSGIVLNDPSEAEEREVALPKKPSSQSQDKKRRPSYSPSELSEFGSKAEIRELVFATEQYLGRTLNPSDMKTLLFIYDELGFSGELIEYLIEYCVEKDKPSFRYIEQTAMNWAEAGVRDVESAKAHVRGYGGSDYFTVLRAYGISDRKPVTIEIDYVDKWEKEYGFPIKVILEAVSRTMKAIAKPSFPYTDSILKSWRDSGVRTLEDLGSLNAVWGSSARQGGSVIGSRTPKEPSKGRSQQSKVHFSLERQYDFDELEEKLLKKQRRG